MARKVAAAAVPNSGNTGRPASEIAFDRLLYLLKDEVVSFVASDHPDLTQRQLSVLLTVYLDEPPHTVRGLAALLHVSKPAITRALDRLTEFDLIRRKQDPEDRRSVLVQKTASGMTFLRDLARLTRIARTKITETL